MPAWLALCDLGTPGWGEPWFPQYLLYGGHPYVSCPVVLFLTIPILWMMQSHYLINCVDGPFSSCRCFFVWLLWLFFGLFFLSAVVFVSFPVIFVSFAILILWFFFSAS